MEHFIYIISFNVQNNPGRYIVLLLLDSDNPSGILSKGTFSCFSLEVPLLPLKKKKEKRHKTFFFNIKDTIDLASTQNLLKEIGLALLPKTTTTKRKQHIS